MNSVTKAPGRYLATALVLLSVALPSVFAAGQGVPLRVVAPANPPVTINVDANSDRRLISPDIYGVAYGDATTLADLNVPLNRSGGNPTSRYNWQLNADNRAFDWYFESLPYDSGVAGELGDTFIAQSHAGGAQNQEELAGPEQNVQQAGALMIREILALEADFESLMGAFLDEGAHGSEVYALFAGFLAARIHGLQLRVAAKEEMIQAKSLLIQGNSRGAVTSTLAAVSFRNLRIHWAQTS